MLGLRIVQGRVGEFTIAVLGVEGSLGLLADADEVVDGLTVGEVLVQVVLEVLNDVHVLLDEAVSADAREREGTIIQLPGVDAHLRVLALLLELVIDKHGGVVVVDVKVAREVVELLIKLILGDIDGRFARRGGFQLDGAGSTEQGNDGGGELHF